MRDAINHKDDIEKLRKTNIFFFCETWITKNNESTIFKLYGNEIFENKTIFTVYADPAKGNKGMGRPSGGLQFAVNRNLGAKMFTQSKNHLGIKIGDLCIIGVYYPPKGDRAVIEEVAEDITKAIKAVPENMHCIIAGDWNFKPDQPEFDALVELLNNEEYLLASDETVSTMHETDSAWDHLFIREGTMLVKCDTDDSKPTWSDHKIITAAHYGRYKEKFDEKELPEHKNCIGSTVFQVILNSGGGYAERICYLE